MAALAGRDAQADLGITKTDSSPTYTPGTSLTYSIVVSNAGPSDAIGATVADAAWASSHATWRVRRRLMRKPDDDPPHRHEMYTERSTGAYATRSPYSRRSRL